MTVSNKEGAAGTVVTVVTKETIVSLVVDRLGVSKAAARRLVNELAELFRDVLVSNGEISIGGFGKLKTVNRAARRGVNPATGEVVQYEARRAVVFRSGAALKRALNDEHFGSAAVAESVPVDEYVGLSLEAAAAAVVSGASEQPADFDLAELLASANKLEGSIGIDIEEAAAALNAAG